jgi:PAS domain S-box-containing protein
LDRAKTTFFSNVSHEFRTPLTLMLGPLDDLLASHKHLQSEDQERLDVAHRNALRLLKLVNILLDFSRIEAGRVQAVYEPSDVCKLTAEIGSLFHSAMEKAGLNYSIDCHPVLEPVYLDREMWEKIVLNLLSNAFKFTFEGNIALSLKTVGKHVQLQIRDTGVGIPADELPRVFERFHRVESSRARTHEGTGIGLALVQELVKLHGGTVSVESVEGQGSTFTVSIPLGRAHLPADRIQAKRTLASTALGCDTYVDEAERWVPQDSEASADPSAAPRLPAPDPAPATESSRRDIVVLADDNADMRDYVTRLLTDRYEIHAAADGIEALELTRRLRPAVVLTDVMMPGLDGFGLMDAIRKDPALNDLPIILLSARAGEESRVEGLESGADDYLVKPFTARELRARVATHVRMSNLRRETVEREARVRDLAEVESHRLAAIVESSDDAIVSKDLNGIVTSWNAGAERMFGYKPEEIVGRSITMIIPPELQEDEIRILKTLAAGQRIDHFETVRVAKSGERLDISLTISPVRDSTGKIIGAAKIARDITQRKKAEQALRTTERLASVGRLAATVAHEINNPLEAVTNLIYLAKTTSTSPEVRQYLATAEEELDRVSQLTKQTLGFYRETKDASPTRIGSLVTPLLSVFASRTKNKSLKIVPEIRHDPEIMAVRGEIRQLIANLLSNSIDAVTAGGRIRLRLSAATNSDGRRPGVRLTIADTGSGIPPEVRARVFEPFFTTKKEIGTGLGLWVCKNIVEKHGGSIRVKSSSVPGKSWTAFSVFLPSVAQTSTLEKEFGRAV